MSTCTLVHWWGWKEWGRAAELEPCRRPERHARGTAGKLYLKWKPVLEPANGSLSSRGNLIFVATIFAEDLFSHRRVAGEVIDLERITAPAAPTATESGGVIIAIVILTTFDNRKLYVRATTLHAHMKPVERSRSWVLQ